MANTEKLHTSCSPGQTTVNSYALHITTEEWERVSNRKKRKIVRRKRKRWKSIKEREGIGVTTKCSFSFRCTHAARHTPHTCQKSCREGGAERWVDEEGGWQSRRRDGEFVDGERESVNRMVGGEETEKGRGFWEIGNWGWWLFTRRGREKNGGITCYVNERGWLIRAGEINQQLTMAMPGHINIRLRQLGSMPTWFEQEKKSHRWSELTAE